MINENDSNRGFKLWQVVVAFVVGGVIVGSGFMVSGEGAKGFMSRFPRAGNGSYSVDPAKAEAIANRNDVAITRCELAKLLVEGLNLNLTAELPTTATFEDVPLDHPCRSYIEIVFANDLMRARTATRFAPNEGVTRGEAIKYVTNAFVLPENSDHVSQFSDMSAHWAMDFASTAYHWGLLTKNREACYPREFSPDGQAKKNWVKMLIKNAKDPYAID